MTNRRLRHVVGVTSGSTTVPVPVNTVAPVISGTTTVGQTLSSATGSWNNVPTSFAYQWLRDGSAIGGETGSSYVLVSGDAGHAISCQVTAINAGGSASATSNTLSISTGVPVNTVAPAVTGALRQGQTLSTTDGTWTGSPTGYSYQWVRGASNIIGATNNTYVLTSSDVGANITCIVTATNASGNTACSSNSVGPILPLAPTNSVAPTISGTALVGSTLTVTDPGTWANSPTSFAYQWKRGGVAISGETASTHLLGSGDAAANITCTVTASNAGGSASSTSNAIGPIGSPTITAPSLTQTSTAGTSPFTFDAVFNTDNTFAGYTFRVQTASGTGGSFTSTTQDILHILTESEITSGTVDITSDGFLTPSGGFSLRARIERDDGVTSAWSNTLTDTIVSSVAKFTAATGAKKHASVIVSADALTASGPSGSGNTRLVGATIAGATKCRVRVTLNASSNPYPDGLHMGMYDPVARTDFNTSTVVPGRSDSNGWCYISEYGTDAWFQTGAYAPGHTNAPALAAGDVLDFDVDRSGAAGTHSVAMYRNGVLKWTESGLTLTNFTTFFAGFNSNESVTVDFSQSNGSFLMYG